MNRDVVLCWWCYTIAILFALLVAYPMEARRGGDEMLVSRSVNRIAWGVGSEEVISGEPVVWVRGW